MAWSFELPAFRFRQALRLALLAAMETCWVYAVIVFLSTLMNLPPFATPLSLFAVYWIALILGRELPRRQEPWMFLQAAAIFTAALLVLLVARVELYSNYDILNLGWIGQYVGAFVFRQDLGRALITTLAVVYMFVRGLGFGARPLTLWFIGFQFRLGIVVFFGVFMGSAIFHPVEISPWIFVYFAFSLLAIALARMEEMGSHVRYGPRWALILLGGVAIVFFLGLILLQFFTLQSTSAFLRVFSPLALILQMLVLVILVPVSFIAGWLVEVLRPVFSQLDKLLQQFLPPTPPSAQEQPEKFAQPDFLTAIIPLLQTALILALIVWLAWLVARSLNRRMQQADDALYAREALESEDDAARAKRELGTQRKPTRRGGNLTAESIRRIYAAMNARAEDAGIPRREAETPYEFLPRVMQEWIEQSAELRTITEAYVAVHYGEHTASPQELGKVKAAWAMIKSKTDIMKRKVKP